MVHQYLYKNCNLSMLNKVHIYNTPFGFHIRFILKKKIWKKHLFFLSGSYASKGWKHISLLHILVLVKSKNVFCHCVHIFMGILEICKPPFRFKFDHFMSFWKKIKSKIGSWVFKIFSIVNFLCENFCTPIVRILLETLKKMF